MSGLVANQGIFPVVIIKSGIRVENPGAFQKAFSNPEMSLSVLSIVITLLDIERVFQAA